ncbi:MAG: 3-keto-5-aminohexanoate cleavage protein [Alphaproteobacteria bacterium]
MGAVWLEAALNGPWTRDIQPGIPIAVDEIVAEGVACAEAGAAIIHVHAFDEATGRQRDDWQTYARIIEGIRGRCDALVYPTIPFLGAMGDPNAMTGGQRFSHTAELAKRGLIDCAVVDPGSVQIAGFDRIAAGETGFLYANPGDHIRAGLELAAEHGFHPGYAIYEPGFTRLGAALHAAVPNCPRPIYRFMFSEGFAFGFPPQDWALAAHRRLLDEAAPGAPWMVAGLRVDITPLIEPAVVSGGHVRVGLEDAPWGSARSNLDWVTDAVRRIEAAGGTPATPDQVRAAL